VPLTSRLVLSACILFTLLAALFPIVRSCFRTDRNYNEGWNVYNAELVANHQLIYPAQYAWTGVNYPMLSFVISAQLHHITHDYLFTGRALSILAIFLCSLLVGAIVRRLGATRNASFFAGLFTFALFCTAAPAYVGMDDPQLPALVFFLAAFWIYLRDRTSLSGLALSAFVFVLGCSTKHNSIDFPFVVLIDLLILRAFGRALWFSLCGIVLGVVAIALHIHFGGPFFAAQILAPRGFSWSYAIHSAINVFRPLFPLLCVGLYATWKVLRDPVRRVAGLLFLAGLAFGTYFGGGSGVNINSKFTAFFALAILVGLFLSDLKFSPRPAYSFVPLLLFACLLFPWIKGRAEHPLLDFSTMRLKQAQYDEEVALLRAHPGPALCESILRCFDSGKPYVYDPFNATRLVEFHKLDPQPLVDQIRSRAFGAMQLEHTVPIERAGGSSRFPLVVLDAIEEAYTPVLEYDDTTIYIPKP
jgi:hypothetical protein